MSGLIKIAVRTYSQILRITSLSCKILLDQESIVIFCVLCIRRMKIRFIFCATFSGLTTRWCCCCTKKRKTTWKTQFQGSVQRQSWKTALAPQTSLRETSKTPSRDCPAIDYYSRTEAHQPSSWPRSVTCILYTGAPPTRAGARCEDGDCRTASSFLSVSSLQIAGRWFPRGIQSY